MTLPPEIRPTPEQYWAMVNLRFKEESDPYRAVMDAFNAGMRFLRK